MFIFKFSVRFVHTDIISYVTVQTKL